jgi:hypothetical protein
MKSSKGHWTLVGILMTVAGFIWSGLRVVPFVVYRYHHPKMTETELQIYYLNQLCWWDLAPVLLIAVGVIIYLSTDTK